MHPPTSGTYRPIQSKEGQLDEAMSESAANPPGKIEIFIRRADRFQQDHGSFGFPFAVVQKFGNDQAGSKAALIAYYGLFRYFRSCSCLQPSSATPCVTTKSCERTLSTVPSETFRSSVLSYSRTSMGSPEASLQW